MSLFIHDSLLGHVPNPGFSTSGFGNSFHTIDADGLRSVGERPASRDGLILAVGDSFTYGDEVRDEETWPAQLQRISGRPVLNGGVTGYGFDQIVLRAEQLTALHRPSTVIVSFIAADIWRTEMRRLWWRNKPWFAIEDNQLVLKGVPVPDRTTGLPFHVRRAVERILVDSPYILQRLSGYHLRALPARQGLPVSERLVERLAGLRLEHRVNIVVMAQYAHIFWIDKATARRQRRTTRAILDRAAACSLATLDSFQRLAAEPRPLEFYGSAHFNARGNSMIASLLAAALPALLKG